MAEIARTSENQGSGEELPGDRGYKPSCVST